MITFNTWADVHDYWMTLPIENHFAGTQEELEAFLKVEFNKWVEENYNHTPTFTVKEQDSTDESDAYDRATCHN